MDSILTQRWYILSSGAFVACSLATGWMDQNAVARGAPPVSGMTMVDPAVQANELLSRSPAALASYDPSARKFIYQTLKTSLPVHYRDQANEIASSLIVEANRNELDPIFLLAVIKTESRFHPDAHGRHGEIGLMQLLPRTASWVAKKRRWPGKIDLHDPVTNIRVGAAYLAHLRKHFAKKGSRYLSAYNMGSRNVYRLLSADVEPKTYASRVLTNYKSFYERLESSLAKQERPAQFN